MLLIALPNYSMEIFSDLTGMYMCVDDPKNGTNIVLAYNKLLMSNEETQCICALCTHGKQLLVCCLGVKKKVLCFH